MPPLHVHGLDRFVDDVHAQFDAWAEDGELEQVIGSDGLALLRLAAHEWVANLVQHAEFCGSAELTMSLEIVDNGIRCLIEDSSQGFDFVRQLDAQQSILDAPAPSERGRGLLMLVSCAEDLTFREADGDLPQQISFTVSAPNEEMFASLFRPEDIAFDLPDGEGFDLELAEDMAIDLAPDDVEGRGDGASESTAPYPVQQDPLSS